MLLTWIIVSGCSFSWHDSQGRAAGNSLVYFQHYYKAKVKSELSGSAFLEMWAHVGGGQYFSRGMHDSITGKSDWKSIQTPFLFQKGQQPDKVTLNIVINGTGTVWIDEAALTKEPLK